MENLSLEIGQGNLSGVQSKSTDRVWELFSKENLCVAFSLHIVLGLSAILSNCLFLAIIWRSRILRKKFVIQMGLALADLCNGGCFFWRGLDHLLGLHTEPLTRLSRLRCLLQPYVSLEFLGTSLPPILVVALAVERFVAVKRPLVYKKRCTKLFLTKVVLSCYVGCFVGVGLAYVDNALAGRFEEPIAHIGCLASVAAPKSYTTIVFLLITVAGIVSSGISLANVRFLKQKLITNGARFRNRRAFGKEKKAIRPVKWTGFLTFFLISIPNFALLTMMIMGKQQRNAALRYSNYFLLCYCLNSSSSLPLYLRYSREVRRSFMSFFKRSAGN